MTEKNPSLTPVKTPREATIMVAGAAVGTLIAPFSGWFIGNPPLPLFIVGACFALLGILSLRLSAATARSCAALALSGQVIAINASFAGHPWQIDIHMIYFASVAITVVLNDIKATIAATALIAVHHLSLTFLMPSLVYPSADLTGNVLRTIMHAVVLVAETAAIVYAIFKRQRLDAIGQIQRVDLRESNAVAQAARESAETALQDAEVAATRAENAQAEAEQALQQAASEASRAQDLDKQARESEQREQKQRARLAAQQKIVVESLGEGLTALRNAKLNTPIETEFPQEYETLRADYNLAVASISSAMETVKSNVEMLGSESQSLVSAANDMSRRTEDQASALAEISTTVSQLAESVRQANTTAKEAEQEAKRTKSDVESSASLVDQAVEAMGEIEASSNRIQNIVGVIDEISFQTNLLALNAGVEAARAGESGLGFAVVASEVRNLAQRSAEAAQEIKILIEETDQRVGLGVGLVRDAGDANRAVLSSVKEIVSSIVEIASSSGDQSTSLQEINAAISQLDKVTQANVAMVEEVTAASQMLSDGSGQLGAAVATFETDQNAGKTSEIPTDINHAA